MICCKCKVDKDESEFTACELRRGHWCRACKKEYHKKWYTDPEVKEHMKEQRKQYRADPENRERRRKRDKQYYADTENKERKRKRDKQRRADPEVKERNKKWSKEYMKQRRATNPLFKLAHNLRNIIHKSLKRGGYSKKAKTAKLLGADFQAVQNHLGPTPEHEHHIDHICPVAQAQNEEEALKLCHYTNLRYLPSEVNLSKSDSKTPEGEEMCRRLLNREWID